MASIPFCPDWKFYSNQAHNRSRGSRLPASGDPIEGPLKAPQTPQPYYTKGFSFKILKHHSNIPPKVFFN